MLGLARKPKHKAAPDVHFVVYRSRRCDLGGSMGFKWAAANGITCPKSGRIPGSVMKAYEEANRG